MKRFLIYGIVLLFALTACEQVQDGGATNSLDNSGTEAKLFDITSDSSGHLNKGDTRVFTVKPKYDVKWTVEGANPEGGTAITGLTATRGRLKVGKDETNRTFTVKATSVENPEAFSTVTVTVDGVPAIWTELTAGLEGLITNKTNGWKMFGVSVTTASFGI
jgi:hypothetical protein